MPTARTVAVAVVAVVAVMAGLCVASAHAGKISSEYAIRDGETEPEYFERLLGMECELPVLSALAIDEEMLAGGGRSVDRARELLRKGYPFVTRGNYYDDTGFWHADSLSRALPDWFVRSEGLITAHQPAVRSVLRAHYANPSFLTVGGVPPKLFSEFLFRAGKGQANDRHIDEGCELSYSMQLQGWKMWEFDLPHNSSAPADEVLRCVLRPGDALFFYAGWYHRTLALTEPESVAISMYFLAADLSADLFYNEFGDSLLATPHYCTCAPMWFPHIAYNMTAVEEASTACERIRATTTDPTFDDGYGTADPDDDTCKSDQTHVLFDDIFDDFL